MVYSEVSFCSLLRSNSIRTPNHTQTPRNATRDQSPNMKRKEKKAALPLFSSLVFSFGTKVCARFRPESPHCLFFLLSFESAGCFFQVISVYDPKLVSSAHFLLFPHLSQQREDDSTKNKNRNETENKKKRKHKKGEHQTGDEAGDCWELKAAPAIAIL